MVVFRGSQRPGESAHSAQNPPLEVRGTGQGGQTWLGEVGDGILGTPWHVLEEKMVCGQNTGLSGTGMKRKGITELG